MDWKRKTSWAIIDRGIDVPHETHTGLVSGCQWMESKTHAQNDSHFTVPPTRYDKDSGWRVEFHSLGKVATNTVSSPDNVAGVT